MRKLLTFLIALGAIVFAVVKPASAAVRRLPRSLWHSQPRRGRISGLCANVRGFRCAIIIDRKLYRSNTRHRDHHLIRWFAGEWRCCYKRECCR
jgi:hypothetical protein